MQLFYYISYPQVIAHRVEVTTEKLPEEERPKKASKTKKKGNAKSSPPQQRKASPPAQKAEYSKPKEQPRQQQQQIRILKSDGNTNTTMHSPTQVSCFVDLF